MLWEAGAGAHLYRLLRHCAGKGAAHRTTAPIQLLDRSALGIRRRTKDEIRRTKASHLRISSFVLRHIKANPSTVNATFEARFLLA